MATQSTSIDNDWTLIANDSDDPSYTGGGACDEVQHPGGGLYCDYWDFWGAAGGGPSCASGSVVSRRYSQHTGLLIGFLCKR